MKEKIKNNSIIIYSDKKSGVKLETHLENGSIWLDAHQVATLFGTQRPAIVKHIQNIYKTSELKINSTCSILEQVASDDKVRKMNLYNLDMIISVGYRVNSQKATKFRIWATNVLKKHIVDGYTINESRLLEVNNKFKELQQTISFIVESSKKNALSGQEQEILSLLNGYAKTLTLLNDYDKGVFKNVKGTTSSFKITHVICLDVIKEIKKELIGKGEASDFFGVVKDNSFESVIKNLYQTYDGKELYKTTEDKASHLIYLIIKDHPFSDGNKRIGSFLFVYFLNKTNSLYREHGERKINDNALTALALLIAESNPKDKDILVKMIKNLLV